MHIETSVYEENQHLSVPTIPGKRFIRTSMRDERGNVIPARINLSTGEIKPYRSDKKAAKPKSGKPFRPRQTVVKQKKKTESVAGGKKTRHKKGKELVNEFVGFTTELKLKNYLEGGGSRQLEDIIVGVSYLEDGKEKPLSTQLLFAMLRDIPVFSTNTVIAYTAYTKRHCQKLFAALRCIHKAIKASGCISADFACKPEGGYTYETGIFPDETVVEFDDLMYAEFLTVQEHVEIIAQELIAHASNSASAHFQDPVEVD